MGAEHQRCAGRGLGGIGMNAPPTFSVAVRNKEGAPCLFRIAHETIQNHEQVMALVREEIPDAKVILVGIV